MNCLIICVRSHLSSGPARNGIQVLVADGSESLRGLLCDVLRDAGFAADEAATASEFKRKLLSQRFGLIIMDTVLPGLDVRDAGQTISDSQHCPGIVVMSGGSPYWLDDARRLNTPATLRKPFGPDELLAAAHLALTVANSCR